MNGSRWNFKRMGREATVCATVPQQCGSRLLNAGQVASAGLNKTGLRSVIAIFGRFVDHMIDKSRKTEAVVETALAVVFIIEASRAARLRRGRNGVLIGCSIHGALLFVHIAIVLYAFIFSMQNICMSSK